MDVDALMRAVLQYFQNFDGTKALQMAYYTVALIVASIGLWKTIRYAEAKMPKRLLEFAARFEGRITEAKKAALERIRATPAALPSTEFVDLNSEMDRAMRYLDRGDPARAASELEQLAVRLDEKIKLASVQLQLTRQQAATVHLLFGSLAKKVPQRADQSLAALKRALDLAPDDPDVHKEVGLLKKDSGDLGSALECFEAYFQKARAARHLTDRELLEIDACQLAAECHRAVGSPDLEKNELENALKIAEAITGTTKQPHALKATILRDLGRNAFNRKSPQMGRVSEFFDRSAAEFRQAGMTAEATKVLAEKHALAAKAAGNMADQGAKALIA